MPIRIAFLLLLAAVLGACDEAHVGVELATADLDGVSSVGVRVQGVDLLDEDGDLHSLDSDGTRTIELRALAGGHALTLIDSARIDSGHYSGLRLRFADDGNEVVRDDGGTHTLTPRELESFADIDLDVDDEQSTTLVVTLDLRFSLQREDDGRFSLHQVLHAVEADRAASIGGSIDANEVESSSCTDHREAGDGVAVYLFPQGVEEPKDYVEGLSGPIASSAVIRTSSGYAYDLPYLRAGTYTLAWTCQADEERRDSDESLTFRETRSVTMDEGEAKIVDF